jgi:hypothetical protein
MKIFVYFNLVFLLVIISGCSSHKKISDTTTITSYTSEKQNMDTLSVSGYGYESGDIVLIDTQKEPNEGDIVQFDRRLNNSDCTVWGPRIDIAKIIGLPGELASFKQYSYEINEYSVNWTSQGQIMWGNRPLDNAVGMTFAIPDNELLVDKCVGLECQGVNENGSIRYYRFSIKRNAIIGVVVDKIGHTNMPQPTY